MLEQVGGIRSPEIHIGYMNEIFRNSDLLCKYVHQTSKRVICILCTSSGILKRKTTVWLANNLFSRYFFFSFSCSGIPALHSESDFELWVNMVQLHLHPNEDARIVEIVEIQELQRVDQSDQTVSETKNFIAQNRNYIIDYRHRRTIN